MDTTSMSKKPEAGDAAANGPEEVTSVRTIAIANNRIASRELFIGTKEVTIGHEGEVYRLRLTALNKLILTK